MTATNLATGVPSVATSNETGYYTIAALLVGTYPVKAELRGFRTTTQARHARSETGGPAQLPNGGRRRAGDA